MLQYISSKKLLNIVIIYLFIVIISIKNTVFQRHKVSVRNYICEFVCTERLNLNTRTVIKKILLFNVRVL